MLLSEIVKLLGLGLPLILEWPKSWQYSIISKDTPTAYLPNTDLQLTYYDLLQTTTNLPKFLNLYKLKKSNFTYLLLTFYILHY